MKLPFLSITREALGSFDQAVHKEWLITNGLGGYSSSSILGLNTRKYHGLLVSALHPPRDRTVCLAKLDEELSISNKTYSLAVNEFEGKIFSQGYDFLEEFSINPFPKYVYKVPEVKVRKVVFMPKGKNIVVIKYDAANQSNGTAKINIHPLITCRHFHSTLDRGINYPSFNQKLAKGEVEISFSNPEVTVTIYSTAGRFNEEPQWIGNLFYREEARRGESSVDDCFQPGSFEVLVPCNQQKEFAIVAAASDNKQEHKESLEEWNNINNICKQYEFEISEKEMLLTRFRSFNNEVQTSSWLKWIFLATEAFVTSVSEGGKTLLAGYFWFESWGRDTFISLPGLLLLNGRFEEAREVLLYFIRHSKKGLIPNLIQNGSGVSSYTTVDAALWYVNAVLQYLKYTGDFVFIKKELWESMKTLFESYLRGTEFGIGMDDDGLLAHGSGLTWMDARVDGEAVTPRIGKAVEIQALWYNTLKIIQLLASRFEEKCLAERCAEISTRTRMNFNRKFWNSQEGFLFDVVGPSPDASLRPNQIIAAALDFTMLDKTKSEAVIEAVKRELLTPYGLRTLSKNDSRYRGYYSGDRRNRDLAYHNGTVWTWLLGPYITAYRKRRNISIYHLKNLLTSMFDKQIHQAGLGYISEVFDGDRPHVPRGCIAQAWSIAEPLRAYIEDVLWIRPRYEKDVLKT